MAASQSTVRGEPARFLNETVLPYDGDDCLLWPFGKNATGYGMIWRDGAMNRVSRLVCEHANGPPPTPKHEAAHSCGKGHKGCITKRHLRWATHAENMADKLIHGTSHAKLTETDVLAIRAAKGVLLQRELAEKFGVTREAISLIQTGKNWAYLNP